MFLRRRLPSRRGAKNLWPSSSPYQKSSKSKGGRKKRGKTGWELTTKGKELLPLLSLLGLVPQTSTGLRPIKRASSAREGSYRVVVVVCVCGEPWKDESMCLLDRLQHPGADALFVGCGATGVRQQHGCDSASHAHIPACFSLLFTSARALTVCWSQS
jgi:hypothetical protein